MVYLVSADLTENNENSQPVRTLFLVQTGRKTIIPRHLENVTGHVNSETVQVLQELPKVQLDNIDAVVIGSVESLSRIALENLNVTEEVELDNLGESNDS